MLESLDWLARRRRIVGLAALVGCLVGPATAWSAAASVTISRLGFTDDVQGKLQGPAFYLKGDGAPEPVSFGDYLHRLADTPLDVVVMGASYREWEGECRTLAALPQVNSCTTIVIRDPQDADEPEVLAALEQAEVIYFRGGDQCNFMQWRSSAIPAAVEKLVRRGGGTGGGSAGLAIQGALAVYDGCRGSVNSGAALAEPYRASVSFAEHLFDWSFLDNTLTDSHFVKRDRMGRMMAFLCRQLGSGRTQNAWGLGINEGAAIVIDRDGIGTVYGETAYIVQADRPNTACRSEDQPVNYAGYKIWRLDPGSRYDFAQRPQSGFYRVDVEQGQLSGNPYVRPEVEGALAKAQPRSDLSGY